MTEKFLPAPGPNTSYGTSLKEAHMNFSKGQYASEAVDSPVESQLEQELNLLDSYKNTRMGEVLQANLTELKRYAGFSIPKFNFKERIDGKDIPEDEELTKDIGGGMVELGSAGWSWGFSTLQLRPSAEPITQEQYEALDVVGKYNTESGKHGMKIAGNELPAESRKMLDDIYVLTGAKVVRDDGNGDRILQGVYHQEKVFFQESRSTYTSGYNGETYNVFLAAILGQDLAHDAVNRYFSQDQVAKIHKANLGGDLTDLYAAGVDRYNLDAYLGSVGEIRELYKD